MAFSKRNKRKIIVGEDAYYWIHKFQKDMLRLIIMTDEKTHSRLICDFTYKNMWLYVGEGLSYDEHYTNELLKITEGIITPWTVRQVIDYGTELGWKPFTKGKDFVINEIENKINFDFQIESTSENPKSKIQNPKSKYA